MIRADHIGLRRLDRSSRHPMLMTIGQALADAYRGFIDGPLPANLVAILERLEAGSARAGRSKPRRLILVVEDDPEIRSLAATMLEETELEVIEAASAEAALALMQRRGGEVVMIFVDIQLIGELDGADLAQRVATLWPRTAIVVTSGAAGDRAADLPEAAVFLPKPWRALDILVHAGRAAHQLSRAMI